MQFKHPELLYFLALLIIPILVHLFQLKRFTKVPFTNVAFLQKLAIQTRKSSRIKKWLILATRLLGLSALIFAFAQPYFTKNSLEKKQHTFVYLDNSLSTNARGEKGNLLKVAAQELIENLSEVTTYTFLTNSNFHPNIPSSELKILLLKITSTGKRANLNEVLFKISNNTKNKINTLYENILISDFQTDNSNFDLPKNNLISLVKLNPVQKNNISIDSVYVNRNNASQFTINAVLKNQGEAKKNIPIAIYNEDKLVSKQTFNIDKDSTKNVTFSVRKTPFFLGKFKLTFNDAFTFDNNFFFSINSNEKIKVLAIGNDNKFLSKIYTKPEFDFKSLPTKNINYNIIPKQQLIVLNEIEKLSSPLIRSLVDFSKKGGYIIVIPNPKTDVNSYNLFFKNLSAGKINLKKRDTLKITDINFKHPLLKNVFDKRVTNFQYPTSQGYFPSIFKNASNIISFENKKGFIKQINLKNSKLFWAASPLNKVSSNFTNSPLVVPVFYNMGQQSLHFSELYYTIDKANKIDVSTSLGKDAVLGFQGTETSFIPSQQNYQNKVTITTKEQPSKAGFYNITKQKDTLKTIAFNNSKKESMLNFLDVEKLANKNENITFSNSIKETLQKINKKNKVHWLWKWFLALTIVSLLLEILILKYFKV